MLGKGSRVLFRAKSRKIRILWWHTRFIGPFRANPGTSSPILAILAFVVLSRVDTAHRGY
ncbi:hypothetical protein ACJQWK_02829 [Exserohilum turcicum]